jgi:hypothetical protein
VSEKFLGGGEWPTVMHLLSVADSPGSIPSTAKIDKINEEYLQENYGKDLC